MYSHDYEHETDGFNKGLEQWAARFSYSLAKGDVAVVVQKPQGQSAGVGLQFNYTVNDSVVAYFSGFSRQGTRRPQDTRLSVTHYHFNGSYPFAHSLINDDKFYERFVVGLSWQLQTAYLTGELYYDERGLDDDAWSRFIDNNQQHITLYQNHPDIGALALYFDNRSMVKTGTRQKYLFLNASIDLTRGQLGFFSKIEAHDFSAVSGVSYGYNIDDSADISLGYYVFSGNSKSEYGSLPVASEFEVVFKYLF